MIALLRSWLYRRKVRRVLEHAEILGWMSESERDRRLQRLLWGEGWRSEVKLAAYRLRWCWRHPGDEWRGLASAWWQERREDFLAMAAANRRATEAFQHLAETMRDPTANPEAP